MSAVDRMARAARPGKTVIPAVEGDRFLVVKHTRMGVWVQLDTGKGTPAVTVPWSALRDAVEGAPSGLGLADVAADLHPDTGLPRPDTCCGVCPPIAGGGWDCTCSGNPRCSVSAADRPSVPRVGDTITNPDQLDALPVGVVMRARNDLLTETGRLGADGMRVVWGEGWSDHAAAIEHLAPLTVLYVPGEPSRPSVTDNARAEAVRIIDSSVPDDVPGYRIRYAEKAADALIERGLLAAGRAETTTGHAHDWRRQQNVTSKGYRMQPIEVCRVPGCDAARPAETTTATDEDAVTEVARLIDSCIPDDVPGYRYRYAEKAADAVLALLRGGDRDE